MSKKIVWTSSFKRDYKLMQKQHRKIELLDEIVIKLAAGEVLPDKNEDHALTGQWAGYRECHIQPDWLLVYRVERNLLVLTLVRTGTHATIFGM